MFKRFSRCVNITDVVATKSHMYALVTSTIIAQNRIEHVLQFTTGDRNRITIQGALPLAVST